MALDTAGNLYGTTYEGGTYQLGLVFELTPSGGTWMENDLYSFNQSTGVLPVSSVLLDASGKLYGTTTLGGTRGDGVVWQITR